MIGQTCRNCGGRIDCRICSGQGYIRCTRCGGDGIYKGLITGESSPCLSCYPPGRMICACNNGLCSLCSSKGLQLGVRPASRPFTEGEVGCLLLPAAAGALYAWSYAWWHVGDAVLVGTIGIIVAITTFIKFFSFIRKWLDE